MPGSVIVAGARTPIGRLSGALAGFSAMDLGGFAIAAALERAGVAPEQVDYVLMGQVLQAGQGQITARQAAVKAGIPMTVPAMTVNKVCLSGLNSIYLADQMIAAGEAEVVIAGGMESMTKAPYLLPASPGDGTITAGNASQISDGGAAVVVTSRARAGELGVRPLGEVVSYGQVAGPDASLLTQPSRATRQAIEKAGRAVGDVDLF